MVTGKYTDNNTFWKHSYNRIEEHECSKCHKNSVYYYTIKKNVVLKRNLLKNESEERNFRLINVLMLPNLKNKNQIQKKNHNLKRVEVEYEPYTSPKSRGQYTKCCSSDGHTRLCAGYENTAAFICYNVTNFYKLLMFYCYT